MQIFIYQLSYKVYFKSSYKNTFLKIKYVHKNSTLLEVQNKINLKLPVIITK